jgi:hypothetical protein
MTDEDSLRNVLGYEESLIRSTSPDPVRLRSSPLGQQPGGDGMDGVVASAGDSVPFRGAEMGGGSSGAYSLRVAWRADRGRGFR